MSHQSGHLSQDTAGGKRAAENAQLKDVRARLTAENDALRSELAKAREENGELKRENMRLADQRGQPEAPTKRPAAGDEEQAGQAAIDGRSLPEQSQPADVATDERGWESEKGINFLSAAGAYVRGTTGPHMSGPPGEIVRDSAGALGVVALGIFFRRGWKKGDHADRS